MTVHRFVIVRQADKWVERHISLIANWNLVHLFCANYNYVQTKEVTILSIKVTFAKVWLQPSWIQLRIRVMLFLPQSYFHAKCYCFV